MQTRNQSNGNGRGVSGRPDVKAREKFGEERVDEILDQKKSEITALFANDPHPEAMFERAKALAVGAYRKIQDDAIESASNGDRAAQRIDEASAVACCLWAMQRKLDPGTDVYLVPYGGKVTPIISPDGVIKLLFRTGMVRAVNARYVFNGEIFDYELGSTQWVKHKKNNRRPEAAKEGGKVAENEKEWNALEYAYAIIDLKDGGQTIEVLDKADIAYFRSLSPTGKSKYGGWAKFPAAFSRKAALKQASKFVPKESEVSIILGADDTERGIDIPDEIMKAVGARMLREMTGERGSSPGEEPGAPETKSSKRATVYKPGDAQKLFCPGARPQPTIYQADNETLLKHEKTMRTDFDAKKWSDQWFQVNAVQLATIRFELRDRGLDVPFHPAFDEAAPQEQVQQPQEQAQGMET